MITIMMLTDLHTIQCKIEADRVCIQAPEVTTRSSSASLTGPTLTIQVFTKKGRPQEETAPLLKKCQ
jgi:hypothetical protein